MRARMALDVSNIVCELREILLRNKPQAMLDVSSKGTVPVLVLKNGDVLDESLDVILWALKQHDPEQWLVPEHGSLEDALKLIERNDDEFKHHLDRYKYATRYPEVDATDHRTQGAGFLHILNKHMSEHVFLFGERMCIADIAIAPFVRQFEIADPEWFGKQDWPSLQKWLDVFKQGELFKRVMRKVALWESGQSPVLFNG